jgi:hypothetical protein
MQPTKQQATVDLLDKGQFIITYFPDGVEKKIKGRFTMVAFDRFCTDKKIDGYFDLLKKITVGLSIGDYADLFLVAFQDYFRSDYKQCGITRENVLDIIDELGGISEEFLKIIFHAVGRVTGGVIEPEKVASPPSADRNDGHKKKVMKRKTKKR